VLDGLEGTAAATGGAFDRAEMDKSLSRLGNRVFLMNNVHEDKPVVFQSRWALSYLRGPLTQDQIKTLMDARRSEDGCADVAEEAPRAVDDPAKRSGEAAVSPATVPPAADTGLAKRPILPPGVPEVFLACRGAVVRGKELQMPGSTRGTEVPHYEPGQAIDYRPAVLGVAKLHYAQASLGVDHWETVSLVARADTDPDENIWDRAELSPGEPDLESQPEPKARFSELPASLARPKTYAELEASLKNWLYRTRRLKLLRAAALKATSDPGEAERDFRIRLALDLHEERDRQVEKLRARYAPKLASLEEQIRKAVQRVAREQTQASHQSMQTVISVGGSILSAMFGRKLASQGNISRAASSVRQASRAAKEHGDISQAQETVEALRKRREELETEFAAETAKIQAALDHANIPLEELELQPRKSDLVVSRVALAWRPQPGP
jgi:hypothetical protein